MEAHIRDVSHGGLRLSTEIALNLGAFLRIKVHDSVLFGEVKYSCPWMGGYVAGLLVEQVLLGTSELARLVSATWHDVPRSPVAVLTADGPLPE